MRGYSSIIYLIVLHISSLHTEERIYVDLKRNTIATKMLQLYSVQVWKECIFPCVMSFNISKVTLTHLEWFSVWNNVIIIIIMVLFYLFIQYYAVLKEISIR